MSFKRICLWKYIFIHSFFHTKNFFLLKPEVCFLNVTNSELLFFQFPIMVEARHDQTAGFFMKFGKNFRYCFCFEKSRRGRTFENYFCCAYCLHPEVGEYSDIEPEHFTFHEIKVQILIVRNGYVVPCLFSTFSCLIRTTNFLKLNGETIEKLNRAVTCNRHLDNQSPIFQCTQRIRKWVPIVRNRNERSAQTSDLSTVFLSRLNLILVVQHAALFYRIVDVFISGFGTINIEMLSFHFDSSCIKKTILKAC